MEPCPNPTLRENIEIFLEQSKKNKKHKNILDIRMGDGKDVILVEKSPSFFGLVCHHLSIDFMIRSKNQELFDAIKKTSFGEKATLFLSEKPLRDFQVVDDNIYWARYDYKEIDTLYSDLIELACLFYKCKPEEIKSGFRHAW